ncbi:MAG TPA: hypothetical protein VK887_16635, partial [Pseudonocardiaceae bacterium]|nr:hypothetical protein [Pseudonocardiaceae bacterium]
MSRSSSPPDDRSAQFGPNEWLVDEMYEQFLANPSTVDPAWHDFFTDYRPAPRRGNGEAPPLKQPSPQRAPVGLARANSATAKEQTALRAEQQDVLEQDTTTPLRGAAARVVANMETSLALPTATSVRA